MKFFEKNLKKVFGLIYTIYISLVLVFPSTIYAETPSDCNPSEGLCNPLGATSTLPELIKTILQGALKIGIPIVALAIIYSGFLFVFARGNSEKLGKAKDTLLYTLIGAAILLGSWAIAEMVSITVTGLGK